jgi:hypothetical protein
MIKKQVLELLLEELTQPHDLTRLASDANCGTEFSNIQMLTNKITGETRLIVINHLIIQALILEQMSVTIFMEST